MSATVIILGTRFVLDDIANDMDPEIREAVHADLAPCDPQAFVDEYCKRHLEVHGEEFDPREDWNTV